MNLDQLETAENRVLQNSIALSRSYARLEAPWGSRSPSLSLSLSEIHNETLSSHVRNLRRAVLMLLYSINFVRLLFWKIVFAM